MEIQDINMYNLEVNAGVGYIHKLILAVEYELSDAGNSKFKFNLDDISTKMYENSVNTKALKANMDYFTP